MQNTPFIVLDIETTGLSRYTDRITEFSGIKIEWDNENNTFSTTDTYSSLINPGQPIPRFIQRLTGITDDMVKDSPKISDIAPEIREFIGDTPIIAHNATFDYNFLSHNFKKHINEDFTNPSLCTCKLSRRLIPGLSSYKLARLCDHFDIRNEQAHRAMSDVLATKDLFQNLHAEMQKNEITTLKDAIRFQKSRVPR